MESIPEISYSELTNECFEEWTGLALKLWKDYSLQEMRSELGIIVNSSNQKSFVARNGSQQMIAFINVSIRTDYVEGSDASPTGYIEGIYVEPDYRLHGVAQMLVTMAEVWLLNNSCKQIGSDTWDWNVESREFHKKLGFKEEATLVHFIKDIKIGSTS